MNTIIKSVLLIFLFLCKSEIYCQETYYSDININGRVKKITYDSYLAKMTFKGLQKVKKGWEESDKNNQVIELNESGKIVKVSFYDKDSKLVREQNYKYQNGNLVKSDEKYKRTFYYYEDNNKLKRTKTFDKTPDVISASSIDELDGKEKILVEYLYDSKGRLKEKLENNKSNETESSTLFSYNENGLLTKEETTYKDGQKEWFTYDYDSNGNIVTKKWFDNVDGIIESEKNFYSGNELTSSIWENYYDGEIEGRINYRYEKGNEIEVIEYDVIDNSQIKWKYIYEYDSSNNWIKKVAHTFKDEYYIVYRRIEYY